MDTKTGQIFCFSNPEELRGAKELNIGVVGNSEKQALLNFFHFLVKDYLVYKYTPKKKMSKGAKRLLKVYGKFIDEEKQ